MILTTFDNALRYVGCHPGLLRGFVFLDQTDLGSLEAGKHEIDGQRIFAIVAHDQGRGQDGAVLEFHRKYIDIQYVVSGHELIGWKPLGHCNEVQQVYDQEKDFGLFADRPASWFEVRPKSFAIFFPEDAHAPLASLGPVHKVVIKVAIDYAG